MKSFYSHGKLLLSGEYLVLDGAAALALPTRPGQWLHVRDSDAGGLHWISRNPDGTPWFETRFSVRELQDAASGDLPATDVRQRLLQILGAILRLRPAFLEELRATSAETRLEFPRDWGLGSSSTLLSNLAYWSGTDPFVLLGRTLGGSGYDIAAARQERPFLYRIRAEGPPEVVQTAFQPPFADALFFVHLNRKQDSREGISRYRTRRFDRAGAVATCTDLTAQLAEATTLESFRDALERHEQLISGILGMPAAKQKWFPDYPGSIKSLGAWGGDFILATGRESDREYFRQRGFATLRSYGDLIL